MLSFNSLGRMGRFGNQMFQYAALLCIAKRRGYEFCIPPSNPQDPKPHQLFQAFDLPNLKVIGWQVAPKRVAPSSFAYDMELANHCEDNVDLYGYFQSEKYFSDHADLVRQEFTFRQDVRKLCEEHLRGVGGHAISLHVRRTDYLTDGNKFLPCDLAYYARALAIVPADLPVIVFSDDIAWCKQQPLFQGPRWYYSEGSSNIVDMCMISSCTHHIIANSTFSWWGAWLAGNPDKQVVAPKDWFGSDYACTHDDRDLVPEGWERV